MRLSFLLIFISSLSINLLFANRGNAQGIEEVQVTVSLKGESLKRAFTQIEKQSKFEFAFVESQVIRYKNLSLAKKSRSLAGTLKLLLANTHLRYIVKNNTIVILEKERYSVSKFSPAIFVSDITHSDLFIRDIVVKGSVIDSKGNPLSNVNVTVKGQEMGVITDAEGRFAIRVPADATLVFSIVGYRMVEEKVHGRASISVVLQEDASNLNSVVVIGYGTAKKKDLTGSVAQVSAKDVNAFPVTNIMAGLQGRASGVQVMQNNGAPGGGISVRIRGTNSILGGNEPLYVIDGFPYSGNPTFLQNADIQSVEILKDASSIAIYGSRGANGVIIITTKNGHKRGNTLVDFEAGYTVQSVSKKLKLMNAAQYAEFYNLQAANDNLAPYFTNAEIEDFRKSPGTDWQDVVMHSAPLYNTNLSVSGGNEKTQFSVSAGAFLQNGIIRNSDYNRYSLRANVNHDISKIFSFSYNATLTRLDSRRQNSGSGNRGNDLISAMLMAPPTLSPYTDNGAFRRLNTAYPFISNVMVNPLHTIYDISDKIKADRLLANAAITIKPFSGLSIRISGGVENANDRTDSYSKIDTVTNSIGSASVGTTQLTSFLNENVVSYTKRFGEHNISATTGFTYQDYVSTSLSGSGSGFLSDVTETSNLQSASSVGIPHSGYTKWVLLSYIGRLNYSFRDRYLFTVSFRRDGSSRYSADNKWGSFPSAAIAWRISDEEFMQSSKTISDLKLRASYGSTGSTAISPYQTLNQLSASKVIFGDALYNALAPGTTLPGNLKWETTNQFDAGIDAGFLENRIRLTLDYYHKKTKNLLNTVQLPASTGYSSTVQNIGEIENKGFELGLDAAVLADGPLGWNVSANISMNRNKVLKLYGGQDIVGRTFYTGPIQDYINLLREGQPLFVFYGYKEKGYTSTGNVEYHDLNGDGLISPADKTFIGDPNAAFIYGFNSEWTYKGFGLSIFIQGTQGNDIYNLNSAASFDLGMGLNQPADVYLNHWTSAKTSAEYPNITRTLAGNISDRFVEDGSYLRFRNIQLSYNLPVERMKVKWIRSGQVYVSGQNLITLSGYSWYDPAINTFGGSNSINQGIDYFSYPTSKSVTIGFRFGF